MTCKICGGRLGPIGKTVMGYLMHDMLPVWLTGLCERCVYQVGVENLPDYEDPTEPATEILLDKWIAKYMREAAARLARGKSIIRCEGRDGWRYSDDSVNQCERFADAEREGRNVCYCCRGRIDRGKTKVYFIDQNAPRPRPYLIWATSGQDLIDQAMTLAMGTEAK